MFAYFSFLTISTLQPGEDPYEILGIRRDSTPQQIKAAFRKIVFDHHPDRHHDEESLHIYLRASDAYEILSDPEKKLRYDKEGKVRDQEPLKHNQNNRKTPIPLITQQLFPTLASDGQEWIILVTQHFDCPKCQHQEQVWEEIAQDLRLYTRVGKVDASSSPQLVSDFGITKLPQYISVRYINGTSKAKKISNYFSDKNEGLTMIFKFWKSTLTRLKSVSDFKVWTKIAHSKAHVVEVLPIHSKGTSIHFRWAAKQLQNNAHFATITEDSDDFKSEIGVRNLPCYMIFRGKKTQPIIVTTEGRRLLDDIEEYATALFPPISSIDIPRVCEDWCILSGGEPGHAFVSLIFDRPFRTGYVEERSRLFKSLNMSSGSWTVISYSQHKLWNLGIKNESALLNTCSAIYRSDEIEEALGDSKVFSDKEFHIKSVLAKLPSVPSIRVVDSNVVVEGTPLLIPIHIVIIIFAALCVFLFVIGIFDHTHIDQPPTPKRSSNAARLSLEQSPEPGFAEQKIKSESDAQKEKGDEEEDEAKKEEE